MTETAFKVVDADLKSAFVLSDRRLTYTIGTDVTGDPAISAFADADDYWIDWFLNGRGPVPGDPGRRVIELSYDLGDVIPNRFDHSIPRLLSIVNVHVVADVTP